ncbi:MAG: response regulator, partial [Steroidobacteraceae bacterium]
GGPDGTRRGAGRPIGDRPSAPGAETPKAPGRPSPPPGGSGIRLPDGTILAPPGLGPKRK